MRQARKDFYTLPLQLGQPLTIQKAKLYNIGKILHILVAYNNFDFQENVKYQVFSDNSQMRSVTTSKVFIRQDILDGGLRQTMLYSNARLDYVQNVLLALRVYKDKILADILTYFITGAI